MQSSQDLKFTITSLNISEKKGTIKTPVSKISIDKRGIQGDAHAGLWHRQVSILSQESIDAFSSQGNLTIDPGAFAENMTVSGIDLKKSCVLDRITIGEVELEVTQIGKECHGQGCPIFQQVGSCIMPKEGIFCRVLHGGEILLGDAGKYHVRPLQIQVITLSDRAAAGEYADKSGAAIEQHLMNFFKNSRWRPKITRTIIPDDADTLWNVLMHTRREGADVIFTTGGTGVGPRDITPETVNRFCTKVLPGLMEHIRQKYGKNKPAALLSRSIAGVRGTTVIYSLPGSVKAVNEYLDELEKTMLHLLLTVHGIDSH